MKTSKTNVQKITHLMTMNPGGPLAQAFVIEAVRRYAVETVAAGKPEENPRAIICPTAWFDTGRAIASQLEHWSGISPATLEGKS
jgi:hypothetical protein